MKAQEWVDANLGSLIQETRRGRIIALDDHRSVSVEAFCQMFGVALENVGLPDKYAALSGVHTFRLDGQSVTKTGAELGYQPFFDDWHANGLI